MSVEEPCAASTPSIVITKPTRERDEMHAGIAHFGVGVFHRAHLAYYMDVLMREHGVKRWGICGIGVRESSRRLSRQLASQDCLYTLVTKSSHEDTQVRIVGSLVTSLCAPDEPEAVRAQLVSPDIRIVSLTITEPGYELDGNQMVKLDLMAATPDEFHPPHSVWGWIVQAIEERRVANVVPFTVMSCDNLQHNGDKTKECLLTFVERAAAWKDNDELVQYIKTHISCPNSMVDRITPATTEEHQEEVERQYGIHDQLPVLAESWTQWVVTDTPESFPSGRPPLHLLTKEPYNVLLVSDVTPYELMKTRLLNGSHLVISYLGVLSGYQFVYEVMRDADLATFLQRFQDDEVTPTLLPVDGIDLTQYKAKLRARFGNPHCKDTTLRVGRNGATKAPKFLFPTIRGQLESGGSIHCSALAVAAWMRFLNHHDESGKEIKIEDAKAEELGLLKTAEEAKDDVKAILDKARMVFEDLADSTHFVDSVQEALTSLYTQGTRKTIHQWVEKAKGGKQKL